MQSVYLLLLDPEEPTSIDQSRIYSSFVRGVKMDQVVAFLPQEFTLGEPSDDLFVLDLGNP